MHFRQLFHDESCTYTYVLGCPRTREAVLIDPVDAAADRDAAALAALGLRLVLTLETHIHADHVTGAALLRERFGCRVGVPAESGVTGADLYLKDGDRLTVGDLAIHVLATPGHTESCVSYLVDDRVFTGDVLRIGTCGRADFQGADPGRLYDSIHRKLLSLPPDTLVYPGHDYKGLAVSTIAQERRTNPRIAPHVSREEFIACASRQRLEPPRYMDVAVPANLRAGCRAEARPRTRSAV